MKRYTMRYTYQFGGVSDDHCPDSREDADGRWCDIDEVDTALAAKDAHIAELEAKLSALRKPKKLSEWPLHVVLAAISDIDKSGDFKLFHSGGYWYAGLSHLTTCRGKTMNDAIAAFLGVEYD